MKNPIDCCILEVKSAIVVVGCPFLVSLSGRCVVHFFIGFHGKFLVLLEIPLFIPQNFSILSIFSAYVFSATCLIRTNSSK